MNLEINKNFILKGYDISEEESVSYAQNYINYYETKKSTSSLLVPMIALFCPNKCNMNCIFCSSDVNTPPFDSLNKELLERIVLEASEVGVKTIEIAALGEPTLWGNLTFLSEETHKRGITLVFFSNGMIFSNESLCDEVHQMSIERFIEKLYENDVSIIIKRNSMNSNTYDFLGGLKGAYQGSLYAFDRLIKIGFNSTSPTRLGMACVITKFNFEEVYELWKWARNNNIFPFIETLQKIGRADSGQNLYNGIRVDEQKILELYKRLSTYDEIYYGNKWDPQLPYAGFPCTVYDHIAINNKGLINPCFKFFSEEYNCGDLTKSSLQEIILSSTLLYQIRKQRIKNRIGAICINRVPKEYLNM